MTQVADRVFETTTTTGTGAVTLLGAQPDFRAFRDAFATAAKVFYLIEQPGAGWEVGIGTLTVGGSDTLARDTVLSSSNAGSPVNFGPGTKNVVCVAPAKLLNVPPLAMAPGAISNNATDALHDIDIVGGSWRAEDAEELIALSATTIAIDAAGNGGRLDGETLTANTTYHVLSGRDTATGSFVAGFKKTVAKPSGWDYFRRHGSVLTDGASTIIGFSQRADEFLRKVPFTAFNVTNPGATAVLRTAAVPTGIQVLALNSYELLDVGTNFLRQYLITSPDQTDTAPSQFLADLQIDDLSGAVESMTVWTYKPVRTNTSGQVRTRLNGSTTNTRIVSTNHGWIDSRGRD